MTTTLHIEVIEPKRRVWKKNTPQRKLKRKRKTEVGLWREWLVPDTAFRRYKGLRGIYWYWLSRDIRKSEWIKWDKKCLTCLEVIEDWQYADCGHILASRVCGEFLRFNPINLTIQHKGCNNPRFCPQAGVLNTINIDKRMGAGYMEYLLSLRKQETKEPTAEQYHALIRGLKSYQEALTASSMTG